MRFSLRSDKARAGEKLSKAALDAGADAGRQGGGQSTAPRRAEYESTITKESLHAPGVSFTIYRVSFGRRMELSRLIRDISRKIDFLNAGDDLQERIEANVLAQEIEATYLRWGLAEVRGLSIDGNAAGVEALLEKGPEALAKEILLAIQRECGLSEEERKN